MVYRFGEKKKGFLILVYFFPPKSTMSDNYQLQLLTQCNPWLAAFPLNAIFSPVTQFANRLDDGRHCNWSDRRESRKNGIPEAISRVGRGVGSTIGPDGNLKDATSGGDDTGNLPHHTHTLKLHAHFVGSAVILREISFLCDLCVRSCTHFVSWMKTAHILILLGC